MAVQLVALSAVISQVSVWYTARQNVNSYLQITFRVIFPLSSHAAQWVIFTLFLSPVLQCHYLENKFSSWTNHLRMWLACSIPKIFCYPITQVRKFTGDWYYLTLCLRLATESYFQLWLITCSESLMWSAILGNDCCVRQSILAGMQQTLPR